MRNFDAAMSHGQTTPRGLSDIRGESKGDENAWRLTTFGRSAIGAAETVDSAALSPGHDG